MARGAPYSPQNHVTHDDNLHVLLEMLARSAVDRTVPPIVDWLTVRLRVAVAQARDRLTHGRRPAGRNLEGVTTTVAVTSSAVALQACLAALTSRARAGLDAEERWDLLAAAWWSGGHDLVELAAAAGLGTRYDQVRTDLRARGVDTSEATFGPPPGPLFAPLRTAEVRALGDVADRVVGPVMLTPDPEPLAETAWRLRLAFERLAVAVDPAESTEQ
ncbi:hypothetical protein ABT263_25330 [Kitasatospora sp. NPDC001603]|uniref:hypothetical protein n=1 Tax=Kitasatospora sp. NPDC001603 TaxID=3154388 RepID=UPI003320C94F